MDIEESTLLEIWDAFSDHLPPAKRNEIAVKYLRIFTEHDIDISDLDELRGEDEHLDHAFAELELDADPDDDVYDISDDC